MINELTIKSDLEKLELVRDFVESNMDDLPISGKDRATVAFCLIEAVVNAIKHGNKYNPEKNVVITFDHNTKKIIMTVSDEGSGFNPDKIDDPRDPARLNQPFGRGIFFMRQMLSSVDFKHTPSGMTTRLEMNLS
jgi:serine/threonine-protein kinase RsbW